MQHQTDRYPSSVYSTSRQPSTLDDEIIIQCLELTYGIKCDVLSCLRDYLTNKLQSVSRNDAMSTPRSVHSGMLQGSELAPFCLSSMSLTLEKLSSRLGWRCTPLLTMYIYTAHASLWTWINYASVLATAQPR